MKTIHLILTQWIWLAVLTACTSCDSFVEVELPKNQLTAVTVFQDYHTAEAAMADIYSNLRDKGILAGDGTGISNQLGNYSDEMVSNENPSNPSIAFYANALLPSNTYITGYWNSAYYQIYAANAVIEGVTESKNLTDAQKRQLQGEALFVRALVHFYLVNLFGDVPYVTQTDYKINSTVKRTPSGQVYEQIIADLENAAALLPESYPDPARVRPNAFTAKALLARTFLYTNAYPEASNMASAVLNQQQTYSLEQPLEVFLNTSRETIWQLQSGAAGQNSAEGSFFIFTSVPPRYVSLSESLADSFSPDDLRRSTWIKSLSDETAIWYHPYKYKENIPTAVSKEYSIVFRLAEQYLIRAEARAWQGDLIGAKEDLNRIRNRAGLPDTLAETQNEILDAVLLERKLELFTETGHRFFDLKRTGRLDAELARIKQGWNSTDSLFPIPQSELSANPNLRPQNPGY
ncbi:RagB/SusD family nutrient uptake outer membrane protein [Flavobacterium ginsenosidimutans]|uniref:RagB/SusD family nutrient uptake outer membrane protein n=1 Tax=Flavobacterium ginsenosidimutans TaxID=687844 RepID=A0ABZ2Q6Y2_9FLAO